MYLLNSSLAFSSKPSLFLNHREMTAYQQTVRCRLICNYYLALEVRSKIFMGGKMVFKYPRIFFKSLSSLNIFFSLELCNVEFQIFQKRMRNSSYNTEKKITWLGELNNLCTLLSRSSRKMGVRQGGGLVKATEKSEWVSLKQFLIWCRWGKKISPIPG